jgi:hypothetical protein
MWEDLIFRMENSWRPSGYYLFDEYLNDLTSRSALSRIVDKAPAGTRGKMSATLALLDKRFLDQTANDGGVELRRWRGGRPPQILPILWERKPKLLPWDR